MKKRFSRLRLKRVKRHLNAMRRKPVKTYLERAQKTALDRDICKLKKELEVSQNSNLELSNQVDELKRNITELRQELLEINVMIANTIIKSEMQ